MEVIWYAAFGGEDKCVHILPRVVREFKVRRAGYVVRIMPWKCRVYTGVTVNNIYLISYLYYHNS